MKIKIPFKAIACSIAILSIFHSCEQDTTENTQETSAKLKKAERKVETAIVNGKSVLKITFGNEVKYMDSYLIKETNTLLSSSNNTLVVKKLNDNNRNTSKSVHEVVIDNDNYLGDGYMIYACKGDVHSIEVVEMEGKLWIQSGGVSSTAGTIALDGLSAPDMAYFQCLMDHDLNGVITVRFKD
ncbi:hypothetical protein [Chryseobacterium culicis]|uniref:Uncharacterized protein n=1 Tax=Chryseobacterium culicis TaxID=680127 RepID=A0A1H6HUT6_CHRCI|nr:hypothetical protein [Chryseobacterium culicis]SEH39868.1 hypothetical protein SAMN05421593_3700 [Chryseobacterium culicis]